MNIAYLISAHTDPTHLKRLIGSLHEDAHFFIHIDRKSDIDIFTSQIKGDNIHFVNRRTDVRWGTINEVDYQMTLIAEAVAHPVHFDRIFFLSGLDYPLWGNSRITGFMDESGDREYLQGICCDTKDFPPQQYANYSIIRPFVNLPFVGNKWNTKLSILGRHFLRIIGVRKKLNLMVDGKKWKLYKGSAWWAITEELASYVLSQYNTHGEIRKYFKHQFCPAETLIQTIAFNSDGFAQRCMLFTSKFESLRALTPLHHIDYSNQIKVWTISDYEELKQSGKMFARKFMTGKSDELMDKMDSERNSDGK